MLSNHYYTTYKLKAISPVTTHITCENGHTQIQIYLFIIYNNHQHSDAIRYSFGHMIQSELDRFAEEWNRHRIRRSHMAELPPGIPQVLYNFPDLHGKLCVVLLYNKSLLSLYIQDLKITSLLLTTIFFKILRTHTVIFHTWFHLNLHTLLMPFGIIMDCHSPQHVKMVWNCILFCYMFWSCTICTNNFLYTPISFFIIMIV